MSPDERWTGWLEIAPRPALPALPISTLEGGPPTLEGQVVLITGGSSGLGRSLIELCLVEGAHVSTLSRRPVAGVAPDHALRFAQTIGDVTRPEDRARWIGDTLANWGRIDALINNAAIVDGDPGVGGGIVDLHRLFEVNAVAPDELIRLVAAPMRARGRGRIINITSELSMTAPPAHLAGYAATKVALNQVTLGWAARLAPDRILVNALFPGHFRSRLNPTASTTPRIAWPMTRMLLACDSDGPTGRVFSDRHELHWFGSKR